MSRPATEGEVVFKWAPSGRLNPFACVKGIKIAGAAVLHHSFPTNRVCCNSSPNAVIN